MDNKGTVYFFTGLSGAGKTTLGGLFYRHLRAIKPNVVLLDGDQIRPVYLEEIGYTDEDRLKGARRTFRVARMLADQGIDVVVCSICMYSQVRDWNRAHIDHYREIYVKVSRDVLARRNQKGLYTTGRNVVGVDLPFDEPKTPDLILENDGHETPEVLVRLVELTFGLYMDRERDGNEGFDFERGHGQPYGQSDRGASQVHDGNRAGRDHFEPPAAADRAGRTF
jgi:adenylylsulfate kinase